MSAEPRSYATFEVDDASLQRAVDHLVRLVDVDATSGHEAAIVDATEAVCGELDLPTRRMPVAEGRDNLLVGDDDPKILLCTHLDTVPPHIPARRSADVVHGRGSADAKGQAVAMLYALRALAREGIDRGVGALLVVGEETDHAGAKAAVASGLSPRWVVLGEPCGTRPALAQKGLLKLRLYAAGTAGHSAYPDVGVSAVHRLLDTLEALRRAELPADAALGRTTLNVGELRGGVAANVIAPSAEAIILVRCAAPVDAVLSDIQVRLTDGVHCEELGRAEPFEFEHDPDRTGSPAGPAVPFNTDAHSLAPLGAGMLLLGPGDMRCAHSPREHLTTRALREGIEAYARLVVRLQ